MNSYERLLLGLTLCLVVMYLIGGAVTDVVNAGFDTHIAAFAQNILWAVAALTTGVMMLCRLYHRRGDLNPEAEFLMKGITIVMMVTAPHQVLHGLSRRALHWRDEYIARAAESASIGDWRAEDHYTALSIRLSEQAEWFAPNDVITGLVIVLIIYGYTYHNAPWMRVKWPGTWGYYALGFCVTIWFGAYILGQISF